MRPRPVTAIALGDVYWDYFYRWAMRFETFEEAAVRLKTNPARIGEWLRRDRRCAGLAQVQAIANADGISITNLHIELLKIAHELEAHPAILAEHITHAAQPRKRGRKLPKVTP